MAFLKLVSSAISNGTVLTPSHPIPLHTAGGKETVK